MNKDLYIELLEKRVLELEAENAKLEDRLAMRKIDPEKTAEEVLQEMIRHAPSCGCMRCNTGRLTVHGDIPT